MNKLKVLVGPRITEMQQIITENIPSLESNRDEKDEEGKNKDNILPKENPLNQKSIKELPFQINLENKNPDTKAMSELKLIACNTKDMNKKLPFKELNKTNIDSNSPATKANEDKSVNLFNILKRAKILSTKIKKVLYYKNYLNMTKYQKDILDDNSYFFISRDNKGKVFYFSLRINKIFYILIRKFIKILKHSLLQL